MKNDNLNKLYCNYLNVMNKFNDEDKEYIIDLFLYYRCRYMKRILSYRKRVNKAIEYIKKYESIRAYYEYIDEDNYDEINYTNDFKDELLEILGAKNDK